MNKFAKNCPFCGEPIILESSKSSQLSNTFYSPYVKEGIKAKIHCKKCHSRGPLASCETEAVERWNKRYDVENEDCPFCGEKNVWKKEQNNTSLCPKCLCTRGTNNSI